jgi:hypothetical protein
MRAQVDANGMITKDGDVTPDRNAPSYAFILSGVLAH